MASLKKKMHEAQDKMDFALALELQKEIRKNRTHKQGMLAAFWHTALNASFVRMFSLFVNVCHMVYEVSLIDIPWPVEVVNVITAIQVFLVKMDM